jgi:hypothetical protein
MGIGQWSFVIGHWSAVISDNVVKKPKTAIVIPTSLRRRISSISYYYTFRFTKRSLAALGMTIRIFYEGIIISHSSGVSGHFRIGFPRPRSDEHGFPLSRE